MVKYRNDLIRIQVFPIVINWKILVCIMTNLLTQYWIGAVIGIGWSHLFVISFIC
jgi:hypothetical protein